MKQYMLSPDKQFNYSLLHMHLLLMQFKFLLTEFKHFPNI